MKPVFKIIIIINKIVCRFLHIYAEGVTLETV